MNKHAISIAVCLALQPVIALGAETTVKPGVKERDSKQSFEIQREASTKPDRAATNPRHGVAPEDRAARQSSPQRAADGARSGVEPEDRPTTLTAVQKKPNGSNPYITSSLGQSVSGRKQSDVAKSSGQRESGCKQGDVAENCITFRPVNPNGVASQEANRPDGTQLIHTFPDGARLYASTRNGGIQKYSAIDQRGRALKVQVMQPPPSGIVPTPGNTIEQGKQRAEGEHKRFMERARAAIESGEMVGKGCVVVIADANGGVFSSYRGCPKGI